MAVSLPHCGHTKTDGLGPEAGKPGALSKAEHSSPNRRKETKTVILSKAGFLGLVCLSAVYSDTESDATQFLWIPSVPGSQALLSLLTEPRSSAGDCVSLQAPGRMRGHQKNVQCPAGMQKASHLWDPMSGSPEAAGVCPLVASLILISQKKASTGHWGSSTFQSDTFQVKTVQKSTECTQYRNRSHRAFVTIHESV